MITNIIITLSFKDDRSRDVQESRNYKILYYVLNN